jgi:8-oxo-dGTP pyrophosphatase MutT (NUDIX family)
VARGTGRGAGVVTISDVERTLRTGMASLPGAEAQISMAPRPRPGWRPGCGPESSRRAAALLLVYPRDGAAHLALTVRCGALPQHAGQVSLPGGAVEEGETLEQAALREAGEEIGIAPGSVDVVGTLTPLHIPVSNFVLHPVVGLLRECPAFAHAPLEVDEVLEVPLSRLLEPSALARRHLEDPDVDIPYFDVHGRQVWGATAMVLAEFLWLFGFRGSR